MIFSFLSISHPSIVSLQNALNEACNLYELETVADKDAVVADDEATVDVEATADEVEVPEVTVDVGVELMTFTNVA